MNLRHITYITYCLLFYKLRGYVVKPMGHGSCIMGHWSVFVWVSRSLVTACAHCLLRSRFKQIED